MFRVRMNFQGTPKSAKAFSDKTVINLDDKGQVTALIEDVHEVVIIEFE